MNTKMMMTAKLAFAAVMLAGLAGCASAADPAAMTVAAAPAAGAAVVNPFPAKLQHAMCIRSVTGGEETNPLWVSKVGNDGFKTALSGSLDQAGLSAGASACTYQIDVNLLGLSQPSFGFDMTVTSHVNYKVYDPSNRPVVLETVDAPYTAKVSDAFVAVTRLRLANEGSIRTNIQMFFDKLRAVQ